ncbi:MAG: type II secretion system F family protein [Halanaerobiaceae bacterium]
MSPVYKYEAVSSSGDKISGDLEVERSTMVAKQLKENGYYVTSIEEVNPKKDIANIFSGLNKVKTKDLAVFSQQFAAMIDAGISLVDCLNIMYEQTDHPRLKEVLLGIEEEIETGASLSEAMMKYPDVFPVLYCQLVRAGETGGVLDTVLNELAEHYERQDEINSKVKSALYYPVAILVVAILVVTFLLVRIVPMFEEMFAGFGADLPLPTRMLLGISGFLTGYWWAVLLIIGLTAFAFISYKNTPRGKYKLDRAILKIPVIGNLMRKVLISRFSSTLAILLDSGVDLLSSLTIVEEVVGNKVYSRLLTDARAQIREGINFSRPLSESEYFPSMVVQMVKIGEESGSLEKMLGKISNFYDREVESAVEASISLIEPLMIVFLAVIVGFIVISIALPMFEMYSHF